MTVAAEMPRERDWLISALALGCLVLSSVLLVWDPRAAESAAAEVAPVVGKVTFSSADLRRRPMLRLGWSDLGNGGAVHEQDALFVPPGVEAKVTFLDGTVLELDERTLVVVDLTRAGLRNVSVRQGSVEGSAGAGGLVLNTPQGPAAIAPQSGARLEVADGAVAVAVTKGEATLGEQKLSTGERGDLSAKGAVVQPKWPVQLLEPSRNHRQLFSGTPPKMSLKWEGASGSGARAQLARDRGFAFVLEEHDAAAGKLTSRRGEAGVFWWRVVDLNGRPVSEARRFTVLEDLPPVPLSPRDSEVVLTDEKTPASFSWAPVQGVSRYRLELSGSPDFSTLAFELLVDDSTVRTPLTLPEGRWYWRVRSSGEERADSVPSARRELRLIHKPLPEAPVLLNTEIEVEPAPGK